MTCQTLWHLVPQRLPGQGVVMASLSLDPLHPPVTASHPPTQAMATSGVLKLPDVTQGCEGHSGNTNTSQSALHETWPGTALPAVQKPLLVGKGRHAERMQCGSQQAASLEAGLNVGDLEALVLRGASQNSPSTSLLLSVQSTCAVSILRTSIVGSLAVLAM